MVLLAFLAALALAALVGWMLCLRVPGRSHRGALPAATQDQLALASELARDVEALAGGIGERSWRRPQAQRRAAELLRTSLREAGYDAAIRDENVVAELEGSKLAGEIVVVGAHYDTAETSPGANDNATGVAAVLALARRFAKSAPERTLRFVAFANEEPPHFRTEAMGSRILAEQCRERGEDVVAMLSLETLGCFSDAPGSQRYPLPLLGLLYPDRGDFVTFVGNVASASLVRRAIGVFRERAAFPSQGAALPGWIPGVGWSDHESFWAEGYPAIMITDTALFRDPRYHTPDDSPVHVDFERLARVVEGVHAIVADLAGISSAAGASTPRAGR